MGKLLIIASVVVTLITAGLGFANKSKLSKAQTDLADSQAEATKTKTSLKTASDSLASTKKDLEATKADKAAVDAQLTTATTDLEKAKKDVVDAQAQVTTATTEKATLQTSLDAVTKERDELKAASGTTPGTPQGPGAEVLAQLEEQKTLITKLQSDLEKAREENTKYAAIEKVRTEHTLKQGTEGRILAVNPAWNFVVLSLGDKQGVASNTELLVKRGNQLVGKIRVTSVEPSTSIADIVANSVPRGTVISPGDHVIYGGAQE